MSHGWYIYYYYCWVYGMNFLYVMHMKERSAQVVHARDDLVHFDATQKSAPNTHCGRPKSTARNCFSLWFFDYILLTVNFDSCASCLQEMFPCCLLLPRWSSKSTSTDIGRLGCQIRKWWCKNSHSCSFIPKTCEWTSCGWRHWFQQGVRGNSSSFHTRRIYIRTLSASWQQTEKSIP